MFLQALGTSVAFITFYPAVMLAAFYGGFRAGALATAVAAAVADYFWIEPARSFAIGSPLDLLATLIFVISCLLISWIVGLLQEAQARVRKLEGDRRAELERMVVERTAELALANEANSRHLAAAIAREAELQAVLDAAPAGIWIARDLSYRTAQANRLASAWMRIPDGANSSKSTPGLRHFEIFDKEGLPIPNEQLPLRRAARGEVVTDYEFDWRFTDGERRFGVDLEKLIRSQLAHFTDLIGVRIDLRGPPLSISASAAQTLGMALNELATNAGKYGALSNSAGRVEVAWNLEDAGDGAERFVMSWRESGGPPVTKPAWTGFGSTVISDMTRMSLDADVDLDFAPGGLTWRLRSLGDKILEGETLCVQSANIR